MESSMVKMRRMARLRTLSCALILLLAAVPGKAAGSPSILSMPAFMPGAR